MHPTANSAAFIRETPANQRFVVAGDAGRWAANLVRAFMELSIHNRVTRLAISALVFFGVLALIVPHLMDVEMPLIVEVLLAPTWLVGKLFGRFIPVGNIGTPEEPVYEATPIHLLAGLMFAFLNILLYPVVTYFALSLWSRASRRAASGMGGTRGSALL